MRLRRGNRVSPGDGDHADLQKAIRLHGNFAEYGPLALVALALAELLGAWWPLVVLGCAALLVGRVLHARMFASGQHNLRFRTWGMLLTFLALAWSAALFAIFALIRLF